MIETYPYFFTKDQEPYFLSVSIGNSHEVVKLEALSDSDLKWDDAKARLEEIKATNKKALIKLDLGLEERFVFDSELDMSSYILAVEHLNKTLLKEYKDQIEGIILFDGTCHFETLCPLEKDLSKEILSENLNLVFDDKFQNRLAAAGILGSILHRLVSFIDDTIFSFAIFRDSMTLAPLDRAILFSKERFDHVQIVMQNQEFQYLSLDLEEGFSSLGCFGNKKAPNLEIRKGFLLPSDAFINAQNYKKLKARMAELIDQNIPFRVIGEKIFNDCWNDIDSVVYIKDAIHPMTMRMIRGFEASGGEAIEI